jgi:Putative transposase of IS4/5 family (DUF4096)
VASVAATTRHDLTDAQRAMLAPALPAASVRGRPPRWTNRQIIDGIRWRVRTGAPWRDVPVEYAPWGRLEMVQSSEYNIINFYDDACRLVKQIRHVSFTGRLYNSTDLSKVDPVQRRFHPHVLPGREHRDLLRDVHRPALQGAQARRGSVGAQRRSRDRRPRRRGADLRRRELQQRRLHRRDLPPTPVNRAAVTARMVRWRPAAAPTAARARRPAVGVSSLRTSVTDESRNVGDTSGETIRRGVRV